MDPEGTRQRVGPLDYEYIAPIGESSATSVHPLPDIHFLFLIPSFHYPPLGALHPPTTFTRALLSRYRWLSLSAPPLPFSDSEPEQPSISHHLRQCYRKKRQESARDSKDTANPLFFVSFPLVVHLFVVVFVFPPPLAASTPACPLTPRRQLTPTI